jgi:hypothetical protein
VGQAILLARLVFGDGLGTFRDGVLGQLTRENQTNRCLDFARRDGGTLVVGSELGSLGGDSLENVVDKRVHDGHGLVGDTSFRVDLLQDLVDVGRVSLFSRLLLDGFGVLGLLLCGLCGGFTGRLNMCSR